MGGAGRNTKNWITVITKHWDIREAREILVMRLFAPPQNSSGGLGSVGVSVGSCRL